MKTQVIFRKFKEGDIIAIFPYEYEGNYKVSCYAHIGQHSHCDYESLLNCTKLAKPNEYADLLTELSSSPYFYDLEIIQRVKRYKMYKKL